MTGQVKTKREDSGANYGAEKFTQKQKKGIAMLKRKAGHMTVTPPATGGSRRDRERQETTGKSQRLQGPYFIDE